MNYYKMADMTAHDKRRAVRRKKKRRFQLALLVCAAAVILLAVQGIRTFTGARDAGENAALAEADGEASGDAARVLSAARDTEAEASAAAGAPADPPEASAEQSAAAAFSDFYYYEADKAERYAAFQEARPDTEAADVVWRVNAGLDGRHYEDVTDVANPEELLVIVNKYNRLDPAYAPEGRVSVSNVTVRAEAGAAYREMEQAAGAEGLAFIAQSGYRSYDYQNQLYTNYKATDPGGADTYSARPGFSEHQTGLAIDLNLPSGGRLENFVGTKQAAWVAENAHLYGFIVRYTEENKEITGYISEPWHVRYIGPAHAGRMKAEGISSFEEYWVKFIRHQPPGEGLGAGGRTS